ncbi:MAG: PilZ domain-containing protein [Candidatus Omnitrophica bacterium]|nr:PilZ domain-containing protein [Candidatus Omnitrophota bacterium]
MDLVYSGPERRAIKRIRMNCTVIYRMNQPPNARFLLEGKDMVAQMIDINRKGMAMVTDIDIPPATVLSMRFTLLKVHDDLVKFTGPMEVTGEVRSNVPLENNQHRLGIYFKKVRKVNLSH